MITVYKNDVRGNEPMSTYFVLKEIKCRCFRCRLTFVDSDLLLLMDVLRKQWGKPIIPTSLYRCDRYNSTLVKSSKFSAHLSGQAVDILLPSAGTDEFIGLIKTIFPFCYHTDDFIHAAMFRR